MLPPQVAEHRGVGNGDARRGSKNQTVPPHQIVSKPHARRGMKHNQTRRPTIQNQDYPIPITLEVQPRPSAHGDRMATGQPDRRIETSLRKTKHGSFLPRFPRSRVSPRLSKRQLLRHRIPERWSGQCVHLAPRQTTPSCRQRSIRSPQDASGQSVTAPASIRVRQLND